MEKLEGPDNEIVSRLNTAYRRCMVVGKEVFVPSVVTSRTQYSFKLQELRLHHFLKQTDDLSKACEMAGIPEKRAKAFLKSRDYKAFAQEMADEEAIQAGWNPRRLVIEYDRIYKGEVLKNDTQMDALRNLKEIVIPNKRTPEIGSQTNNIFLQMPQLTPEVAAKLRAIADEAAEMPVIDTHAA